MRRRKNTPICDFVRAYAKKRPLRLHMPGHKGRGALGVEAQDITEITGADVLYHGSGIIAQSQANATRLFRSAKTVYSTEGSSLSIRAALLLLKQYATEQNRAPQILAARNAHKSFMNAAALLDLPVAWVASEAESLFSFSLSLAEWERAIYRHAPLAVYITSPDYLGKMADVAGLADLCHKCGCLLIVDNAHGAYLRLSPQRMHPLECFADIVVDSAHKTLPVLTGGGYLHIGHNAPAFFAERAEAAMAFFASTSPSYLILQSLDAANAYIDGMGRRDFAVIAALVEECKEKLTSGGYTVLESEPWKITLLPKSYGYTGDALAAYLEERSIIPEFADKDYLVLMPSAQTTAREMKKLTAALLSLPKREPITEAPPALSAPSPVLSLKAAVFAKTERLPVEAAVGRILASASVSCPPAVPILIAGERIDEGAVALCRYYGVDSVLVVIEKRLSPHGE
ncbi:MAG: aminotransferase class V-fold PLP-dependent enzyme [Clostridia bacterium]|nr:aminotransferase class V-fold PLP-dependent enzyme [Clostridia bacterium]